MKLNKNAWIGIITFIVITASVFITAFKLNPVKLNRAFLAAINLFNTNQITEEKAVSKPKIETPYSKEVINQILQQRYMAVMAQQANRKNEGKDAESRETIEEALHALHHDPDELERELAVMTLGDYTSAKAKAGILYALNDAEAIVREQAVVQISEWEDPEERQSMILSALNNKNTEIVVLTLESITHVDSPRLIKHLKHLSKSNDEEIRVAAQSALEWAD